MMKYQDQDPTLLTKYKIRLTEVRFLKWWKECLSNHLHSNEKIGHNCQKLPEMVVFPGLWKSFQGIHQIRTNLFKKKY